MPKNEAKLFFLLVSNIEKVVSYKVIENYVWSEKPMSNEALRMTIKKIRVKTDADLIKNISGVGYKLSGASLNLILCSFINLSYTNSYLLSTHLPSWQALL